MKNKRKQVHIGVRAHRLAKLAAAQFDVTMTEVLEHAIWQTYGQERPEGGEDEARGPVPSKDAAPGDAA